jgi:hypothetical protein
VRLFVLRCASQTFLSLSSPARNVTSSSSSTIATTSSPSVSVCNAACTGIFTS